MPSIRVSEVPAMKNSGLDNMDVGEWLPLESLLGVDCTTGSEVRADAKTIACESAQQCGEE